MLFNTKVKISQQGSTLTSPDRSQLEVWLMGGLPAFPEGPAVYYYFTLTLGPTSDILNASQNSADGWQYAIGSLIARDKVQDWLLPLD